MINAQFPDKLRGLFEPHRYKVLYGGRGGAKSWGIARALLVKAAGKNIRILCAREFQNSISDSVHRLLSQQIEALGLSSFYTIQNASIIGLNGSEFVFAGIRNNVSRIKSYEGIDIVWVEEAQNVSHQSWETLIPTVRKSGSEIWISFNPELETDQTYQRFVVSPPENAWVQRLNWSDNPWFPEVLDQERRALRSKDPDAYDNVWEGRCRKALSGAVYAKELRASEIEQRITRVPYDQTKPVHTFWDLGHADATAIWFAQTVGMETRVLRYYENHQEALPHYLQQMQTFGYVYGTIWLPHDARSKQLATGKSIEEMVRGHGYNVRIVPQIGIDNGINAARTIFPNLYFDQDKCRDGIQHLRHYRYDTKDGRLSDKPIHDEHSHAADALRYLAVALKGDKPKAKTAGVPFHDTSLGWMNS